MMQHSYPGRVPRSVSRAFMSLMAASLLVARASAGAGTGAKPVFAPRIENLGELRAFVSRPGEGGPAGDRSFRVAGP